MHLLQIAAALLIGAYAPSLLARLLGGPRRATLDQLLADIDAPRMIPKHQPEDTRD